MSATLIAAVLVAQSAFSLVLAPEPAERVDVAYTELSAGDNQAAIAKLESSPEVAAEDPAALINLGAAYARAGMTEKALRAYRSASKSSDRYDVELADGSWMDSRVAARTAITNLKNNSAQALRQ